MAWELNPFNRKRSNLKALRSSGSYYPAWPSSEIEEMFDDFFNSLDFPAQRGNMAFVPSLDFSENDSMVKINCELPGLDKEEIDVSLNGNLLSIEGEKRSEEEVEEKGTYRSERRFGSFMRTVELPNGLDLENVEAHFSNGVLRICIPKTEEYKRQRRSIPVGSKEQPGQIDVESGEKQEKKDEAA